MEVTSQDIKEDREKDKQGDIGEQENHQWSILNIIHSKSVCSPAPHNGQSLFFRILRSKATPHLLQTCISWVKIAVL